ncbi:EI24 domain-containing protein [Hydrogenovibrio sp. SC-1]|uniref:EI24 domain-containing protein n=1 Tax=Hydrogenovibrio sp. SC-1 TaxID=2065820 RepID=UPI001E33AA10|nr:EI24 domain-containing protein [Hydrogenovibrio sp. SC-1]
MTALDLIWKTLGDLKSPKILIRLFIPFAIGLVLVSLLGYGLFGWLLASGFVTDSAIVQDMNQWQLEAESTIGAIPLIGGLLLWFLGMVFTVIAGLIGIILGSYLVLLFAMIITGFMTDSLVKAVHDLHYPHTDYQGHGSLSGMLWKMTLFGLGMVLLLLLTLPLLFIPLVNLLWFWAIGFIFFRYALVLDVGQVILPEPLFKQLSPFNRWTPTVTLAALFSLSLLPMISFFVPVFGVIALAHYYFDQLSLLPVSNEEDSP